MRLFLKDKTVLINLVFAIVINGLLWLFFYLKIPRLELIPLHYNVYFGIDLVGAWYRVFVLPGGGLLVISVNFLLSYIIYSKEKPISYFLVFASSAAQVFLLIAGTTLVLINL